MIVIYIHHVYSGFIQPAFVEKMLLSQDADGFNDRQLIDFPPERELYLRELKVPVPVEIPKISDIYGVLQNAHKKALEYSLQGEAYAAFENARDTLVDKKQASEDEDIQGILSKAKGYTARLAMVLFALEQAITHLELSSQSSSQNQPTLLWSTSITQASVEAAEKIITSLYTQKVIMLDKHQDAIDTLPPSDLRKLSKILGCVPTPDGVIRAYQVAQKGIVHHATQAQDILSLAQEYGFGEVQATIAANNRQTKLFRKRKFDDLSEISKMRLKKLKLTPQEYNGTFQAAVHLNVTTSWVLSIHLYTLTSFL